MGLLPWHPMHCETTQQHSPHLCEWPQVYQVLSKAKATQYQKF